MKKLMPYLLLQSQTHFLVLVLCNVHVRSYPLNEQQEQITLLVILHHFVSTMYNNKKFCFIGTLMWLLHQQ